MRCLLQVLNSHLHESMLPLRNGTQIQLRTMQWDNVVLCRVALIKIHYHGVDWGMILDLIKPSNFASLGSVIVSIFQKVAALLLLLKLFV